MAGQQIVLTGVTFTDTTLPKIRDDRILSDGSLFLSDMGHSLGKLTSAPTNGTVIPNVAKKEASLILGVSAASLEGSFVSQAQAADALFQLSSKGGIHGIYSQVNNTNAGRGSYIKLPLAVSNYLIANKSHQFYMSSWVRRTRAALATPQNGLGMRWIDLGFGGSFLATATGANASFKVNANSKIVPTSSFNTETNRYLAMSGNAGSGDNVTNPWGAMVWGGILSADTFVNVAASDLFYRDYIEDLTVSGRNYAEVEAIDNALWLEAFAVGGKFYNDTFTAPSTFP